MKNGMTHGERHRRRALRGYYSQPALSFLDYVRNGTPVSKWKLLTWSLNGLIPIMDDEQLRKSYGEKAFAILVAQPEKAETAAKKGMKRKKKVPTLKRKKRKLMPSDYAWILRESGRSYESAPDPRLFLNAPRSGHKNLTEEEREQQKQQRLQEWWQKHTEEIARMKTNASLRRASKKLRHFRESLFNLREQEAPKRKTVQSDCLEEGPRTAAVRVKPELYEIIVCGECPVFIWKEKPGLEDLFQPNALGPVKRVAVRPPGNSKKTPWAIFEVEWTRRKLREGISNSEWVWEIGLGERVKEDED